MANKKKVNLKKLGKNIMALTLALTVVAILTVVSPLQAYASENGGGSTLVILSTEIE